METVLVTGGAGFIGSHVAERLLTRGHRVIVLDNLSTGVRANVPGDAEFFELDVRDERAARLIVDRRVTVLCHEAAQMNVRRSVAGPRDDADVNILGLLNLLPACVEADVARVVFASSGGTVYGQAIELPTLEDAPTWPLAPYGVAKLACERYLYYFHHEQGLQVTCLRYGNVFGPRQNPMGEAGVVAIFLDKMLAGQQATIFGDGSQTRDYVYIDDVVTATVAAVERSDGYQIYNVGTGVETSVSEIAAQLLALLPGAPTPIRGDAKAGELARSSLCSDRLAERLAARPRTSFSEGLRRTLEHFGHPGGPLIRASELAATPAH